MLEKLGPYKLESLLGRGGMGAVYIARHDTTGELAAVKLLSGHLADDANFRERFRQEIATLKRLLHPNILQLHGYGEEDGNLYYVMELIQGRSLQDELSAGRRFDWREVVRIGIAIALALRHAHDRGQTAARVGEYTLVVQPGTLPVDLPPVDLVVEPPQREFENVTTDLASLRSIATKTTGAVVAPYATADLTRQIPDRSTPILMGQSEELWNKPFALLLVVLLATIEWLIRKSAGLI